MLFRSDASKPTIAVTSETPPLAKSDNYLAAFFMDDYIGGRYSSTSAVGGAVLSLAFGPEVFAQFQMCIRDRSGYLLRAVGDNETIVTSMGVDKGITKIIGLATVSYTHLLNTFLTKSLSKSVVILYIGRFALPAIRRFTM